MLQPLTKGELAQYIALQDRVYEYANYIAPVCVGLNIWEDIKSVQIEDGLATVDTQYEDGERCRSRYFPADFLTKTLDEIRGIRAAEEKSVAAQKEINEHEEYLRLKAKFEK